MKNIFLFIAALFLLNYNSKNTDENDKASMRIDTNDSAKSSNDSSIRCIDIHQLQIDFKGLKKELEDFSTSTILSKNETRDFYKPQKDGYYGKYQFSKYFEKESQMEKIGHLIIFDNQKQWNYNNNTESFIELEIYRPGIKICTNVEVGSDIKMISDCLGKPNNIFNNYWVYYCEKNNTVMIIKEKNKTIEWIRISYYNDSVFANIESYIKDIIL